MRAVSSRFGRGLALADHRGDLADGQSYVLENFLLQGEGLIRREGRRLAYDENGASRAITLLKRWYRVQLTGSVEQYFFKSAGADLLVASNDWDDESPWDPFSSGGWSAINLPKQGDLTLLNGADVTLSAGALKHAIGSQSWLYLWPDYDASDNTNQRKNIPLRTDGTYVFRHGLTPPDTILTLSGVTGSHATGLDNNTNYVYRAIYEYDDGRLGLSYFSPQLLWNGGGAPANKVHVTVQIVGSAGLAGTVAPRDVTRIRLYRNVGGGTGSPLEEDFFLVGEIDIATAGAPPWTITDTNEDPPASPNITSEELLDIDVWMPPKFKTAWMWKNSLVIANLKANDLGGGANLTLDVEEGGIHKNRIRWSEPGKPDLFRANSWFDVLDDDAGEIKRGIVNPLTDQSLVFFENGVVALGALPSTPRAIANSKGTPAPDSVVEANGLIFSVTLEGIQVIDGFRARDITSDTIGPLWNELDLSAQHYPDRINMDAISQIEAVYLPGPELILWSYPAAESAFNNRILVLDLRQWRKYGARDGVFSILKGWNVSRFCRWLGEGDRGELFAGEADAASRDYVYRILFGNEDETGASGGGSVAASPIVSRVYTGLSDFGRPDVLKDFQLTAMEAQAGPSETEVTIDVDAGAFFGLLGTFDFQDVLYYWGSSTWGVGSWNGPRIVRKTSSIPRQAKGVRMGYRLVVTDILVGGVGPAPFQLFDLATELVPLPTQRRR